MHTVQRVKLENLKFYAFHGLHPEERKTGNHFVVNASVDTLITEDLTDEIQDTLDYGHLYEIISNEMQTPSNLMEYVIQRIINRIEGLSFPINRLKISMKKVAPPFGGNCEASVVEIERVY